MNTSLSNKYILPSPAGAFYCVSSAENEQSKHFLQNLMTGKETFHLEALKVDNDDQLLKHLQKLKMATGF